MKISKISLFFLYIFLILISFASLFPFYSIIITSFKTDLQIFSIPPSWFPNPLTFENYKQIFESDFIYFLKNSLFVSIIGIILSMFIGITAAYGFSHSRNRFSEIIFKMVIAIRMLPPSIFAVPFFLMMKSLNLLNNKISLIITYLPFQLSLIVWILEGTFREFPKELEEAAEIDGLNAIFILSKIIIPLTLPTIGVAFIFGFLTSWNEFLFALILTRTVESKTLPIGIAGFVTSFQIFWGRMSAMGVMYAIPAIVFTSIAQRGLIKGLTAGALKS